MRHLPLALRPALALLLGLVACSAPTSAPGSARSSGAAAETPAGTGTADAPAAAPAAPAASAASAPSADAAPPAAALTPVVGSRTLTVASLTVELFYPASAPASAPRRVYDLRTLLPYADPPLPAPLPRACACVENATPAEGPPRPVVVLLHGYSVHRLAWVSLATRLVAAGYVVVAPDLPAMTLADVLAATPRVSAATTAGKVSQLLEGLATAAPDVRLDLFDLAFVGHSDGANVANALVRVRMTADTVVALAQAGTQRAEHEFLSVVVGGEHDTWEPFKRQKAGFARSPTPRFILGLRGLGHMGFTDDCDDAPGLLGALTAAGVELTGFPARLAPRACAETRLPAAERQALVARIVLAALEGPAALAALASDPAVFYFDQQLRD